MIETFQPSPLGITTQSDSAMIKGNTGREWGSSRDGSLEKGDLLLKPKEILR